MPGYFSLSPSPSLAFSISLLLSLSRVIHTNIHSSGQLPSGRHFEALIKHQVCRGKVSSSSRPACLVSPSLVSGHEVSSVIVMFIMSPTQQATPIHLGVVFAVLINIRLSGADCFCLHQLLRVMLLLLLLLLQHCIPELGMSCGKV